MVNDFLSEAREAAKLNGHGTHLRSHYVQGLFSTVERVGNYLRVGNIKTLRHDVEQHIRANPLKSIVIGMGVGYLLGKIIK